MEPPTQEAAAIEARRLSLVRFEHAAGAAFGCDDGTAIAPASRFFTAPTTLALVTLATALAATITYLV